MKTKKLYSFTTILLLFLTITSFRQLHTASQDHKLNIIAWDIYGYYLYLPATFINNDIALEKRQWIDTLQRRYHPTETFYQAYPAKDGKWVIKYSMGMAVLYSPFFFIAHTIAPIMGYSADGLSPPYQLALIYCGLFYTLIGLIFFRKALLLIFSDKLTALLLVLISLGTNYFYMTAYDGVMSHNFMFALNAVILFSTIRWHQEYKVKYALLLSISLGLAILSRPTEIIWALVPLLWNVTNFGNLIEKIKLFILQYKQVLLAFLVIFLIGLPQLIYWKKTTGEFIFYSYDEKFLLLKPFTLKFLFSYKKGWLLYTPLMVFAIAGFRNLYLANRKLFWGIFSFFIINLWVLSSWECWWYAASYSQRPMMESYVAMAIPMGYFLQWVMQQKVIWRNILIGVLSALFLLNIFQTWQFIKYIIDPERMTEKYYWEVFGKTEASDWDKRLLEVYRGYSAADTLSNEQEFKKKAVAFFNFENDTALYNKGLNSKRSYLLKGKDSFSPALTIPYSGLSNKEFVWIRASVFIYNEKVVAENPSSLVITSIHNGKPYQYRALDIEKLQLEMGKWQKVSMDYLSPILKSETDTLSIYFWHRGNDEVSIDNFKIEIFEPKE